MNNPKCSVCGRGTCYDAERDLYICECFIEDSEKIEIMEKENGN